MTTSVQPLDPLEVALEGSHLIEASAGTGKTYNITALYLRLLLERGLMVEQILVVTFTHAATAELRSRLRSRLREALQALTTGQADDAFLAALVTRLTDLPVARTRLKDAIQRFDEAAVFTIHGFCQRVLRENAFESGVPFDTEVSTDASLFQHELAADFWRRIVAREPPDALRLALANGLSLAEFEGAAKLACSPQPLTLIGGDTPPTIDLSLRSAAFRRMQQSYDRDAIDTLWRDAQLKHSLGKPEKRLAFLDLMDAFLQSAGDTPFKELEYFLPETLIRATYKGRTTPRHPFFDACEAFNEARNALEPALHAYRTHLRRRFFDDVHRTQPERKRRRNLQFFDDLLDRVARAVTGPDGDPLCRSLRRQYPAALIDEFQDTDALQWRIFRTLYHQVPQSALFLIGDPKQAIYRFRGADIFTYLDARRDAARSHTLTTNYRSTPRMIAATNALFGAPDAFRQEGLLHHDIQAPDWSDRARFTIDGTQPPPLRLHYLPGGDKSGLNGEQALDLAARGAAAEIARLLQQGAAGRALIGAHPVQPRDIAVLVGRHREGEAVRRALNALDVPVVISTQQSVFETDDAHALHLLMEAVARPADEPLVRRALLTPYVEMTAVTIDTMLADDTLWETRTRTLRDAYLQWEQHGVAAMLEHVMTREQIPQRLLSHPDGERRLTNLRHLLELLEAAETERHRSPAELIDWLARQRAGVPGNPPEEALLRLESDADCVRIVTIHSSKGLEYPLIFCPFVWHTHNPKAKPERVIEFHDPESRDACLALDGLDPVALTQSRLEGDAESARLLYVAVTRAIHRCELHCGCIQGYERSALAHLLHGDAPGLEATRIVADLNAWAARTENVTWQSAITAGEPVILTAAAPADRRIRTLTHRIDRSWRIASFSSLTAGRTAPDSDRRDHDQSDADESAVAVAATHATGASPLDEQIFSFPRGAVTGTMIHAIFEHLDFTADASAQREVVSRTRRRFGFDDTADDTLCALVDHALNSSLPLGAGLAEISPGRRLNEMEFYFPIAGLTLKALRGALATAPPGAPLRDAAEGLDQLQIQGFMKGYIDLIFEHQGRFYIVDYKSNDLGARLDDYRPERLTAAMRSHGYLLQYAIYAVALHRYLALRLPGYDPAQHLGGVHYLFVRGMRRGETTGIFSDQPGPALIRALSDALGGRAP